MKKRNDVIQILVITVLLLAIALTVLAFITSGLTSGLTFLIIFVDMPSLIILFLLTVPILFVCGLWKDFLRVFSMGNAKRHFTLGEMKRTQEALSLLQRQIICGTILIAIFSVIAIIYNITEPALLGPNLAVVCLSVFYGAIAEIILLPLSIYVKRRIIDYMEDETD